MTDEIQTMRNALAEADAHRRMSRNAEYARTKIRLREKPVVRRGWFGFRSHSHSPDVEFTQEETMAIYVALAEVRDDRERRADEIELRFRTGEGDQP